MYKAYLLSTQEMFVPDVPQRGLAPNVHYVSEPGTGFIGSAGRDNVIKRPMQWADNSGASSRAWLNLPEDVEASLVKQQEGLLKLERGWDGYGAPPLAPDLIVGVVAEVRTVLRDLDCPIPDLCPGGDGSLQVEWHTGTVELCYNVSPGGTRYTWVHERNSGKVYEYFASAALSGFKLWAPRLVRG